MTEVVCCDRCADPTPAAREVVCIAGCSHMQCEQHASRTEQERAELSELLASGTTDLSALLDAVGLTGPRREPLVVDVMGTLVADPELVVIVCGDGAVSVQTLPDRNGETLSPEGVVGILRHLADAMERAPEGNRPDGFTLPDLNNDPHTGDDAA